MTPKKSKTQHICPQCNKEFLGIASAIFCSGNCRQKDYIKQRRDVRKEKGLVVARQQEKISFDGDTDLSKNIRISLPYNKHLSKNVLFGFGGKYSKRKMFMKTESKTVKEEIYWLVKSELNKRNIKFFRDKVWIGIIVQKPSIVSIDAINVIDLACDAIKEAIEVDDKWFSIRLLDWQIVIENPQIIIEIGQSGDDVHKKICRYCTRILSEELFVKNKTRVDGYSGQCLECDRNKYIKKIKDVV